MNERELRRFGLAARFMCSPDAYFWQSPRQVFVIQLEEARERRNLGAQNRAEQSLRKLLLLRFYCCCARTICGSGLPELSFVSVSSV
jgi:hypothetical protein